jgi:hypothetical protein
VKYQRNAVFVPAYRRYPFPCFSIKGASHRTRGNERLKESPAHANSYLAPLKHKISMKKPGVRFNESYLVAIKYLDHFYVDFMFMYSPSWMLTIIKAK